MPRHFTYVNRVNDFLGWINAVKNSCEKELKEAESKSENTFYLQGVVDCLRMVDDSCRVYGLNEMGEFMKDFDVNIKLNVMAKDEDDAREQVKDILTAVAETGLCNVIQIRKVGEYLD